MRRFSLLMALILLIATPLTVNGATPKMQTITPNLSPSGSSVICSVRVLADNMSQEIDMTVKLWDGDNCIRTWHVSGSGYLNWEDTARITPGYTYAMTVDVTTDGVPLDQIYIECDC